MDYTGLANGEKVSAKWTIIGMATEAIKESKFGNVGKWSVDVLGHPTSNSGTVAYTVNELKIIAKKLGLISWKSLFAALNKGSVSVETNAIFNKKGSKFKHHKTGKLTPFKENHLRMNVNDLVLTPDPAVEAFIERQQDRLVEKSEAEGLVDTVEAGKKLYQRQLREAAGLEPITEGEDGEV